MPGKQVTELDALPSFTDNSLLPVHNGAGLKKGLLSQLADYLGKKFSNPNLLINPDFKINQRGSANYTGNGYTVDRWKITNGTVKPQSNGITVTLNNKGQLIQTFENTLSGTYTATIKVTSITGDCVLFLGQHSVQLNKAGVFSITENGSINGVSLYKSTAGTCTINIEWIKLEQGPTATAFVEPNISDELDKCLRYFESGSLDTAPGLAIQPTVYIRTYVHPKRINPTYKFSGNISFEMNGTGKNLSLTYLGTDLNTECYTFRFKPSEATQYGLGFCKKFAYEIDAEIY